MSILSGKRMRSIEDEEPAFVTQRKRFINDKIITNSDIVKLKQVHDKTVWLLFDGARKSEQNFLPPQVADGGPPQNRRPIWQQVFLLGNGEIDFVNDLEPCDIPLLAKNKSKCCEIKAVVHENCANCILPLCEFCGISCTECGRFVCQKCITVFGSGNIDRPLCESCAFYMESE